jgi:hypothetical protein
MVMGTILAEKIFMAVAEEENPLDHIPVSYFDTLYNECKRRNNPNQIPFELMQVDDESYLTSPFPRKVVTEREWYGNYYSG